MERIAVVGTSLAGLRAIEALRREGYGGQVVWIGEEPHPPYDKPPLSKQVLLGQWPAERTAFRQKQGYAELEVDMRLGCRAQALDLHAREITLSDGARQGFDGLVIATGAAPRQLPGAEALEGVGVLRCLDDALWLRGALAQGPRVAVVGGGFIGLEVAACCRQLGLEVTLIEAQPLPLQDVLGPAMARVCAALHADRGVRLRTGVAVDALEGDRRVRALRLADGERIEADVVVVGIGVRPATAWLAGSGLALGDGVACDASLAASAPGVVAAGDVASWPHPRFGERMRIEHWTNAVEQGAAAAARLLHGPDVAPFSGIPYFWSDQYDVKIQFAGRIRPTDDMQIVEGSPEAGRFVAIFGREGRLTGVLAFGRPAWLVRYRRLLAREASWQAALDAAS